MYTTRLRQMCQDVEDGEREVEEFKRQIAAENPRDTADLGQ